MSFAFKEKFFSMNTVIWKSKIKQAINKYYQLKWMYTCFIWCNAAINDLVLDITKSSFNLCVLRYKRYNEVCLYLSKFACAQHFVINVFYCTSISPYTDTLSVIFFYQNEPCIYIFLSLGYNPYSESSCMLLGFSGRTMSMITLWNGRLSPIT